ncbi:MAG: hypothetical protein JWM16_2405 [Verrucomicrobiales bacterium]|nr:hypothetical protein [Verrucomicrobiales bacterium]
MSRGDRREDIFLDDVDRQDFLKTLAEACQKERRKEMLNKMEGQLGENYSGELHEETAEAKAERIMGEEFNRLGWKEAN